MGGPAADSPPCDSPVGLVLDGRYRLQHSLGAGQMGVVFAARDELLDIDIAVKVVRADLVEDDEELVRERLLVEARAAARIGHPAIAQVLAVGTTPDGSPYIVMERLRGENLGQVLARKGRLQATEALATLLPIAHALAAAHEQGVVHRDLKPENVFLAKLSDGCVQPKLIDFGVAKFERRSRERLTAVGSVVGSPSYFSPEHVLGEDVDGAADIWAFAVLLYQLLAGRLPFVAEELRALLRAIEREPHPSLRGLEVADDLLSNIVDRALAKNRADRWQTIDDLGRALAGWLVAQGTRHDLSGRSVESVWLRDGPPTGTHDLPPQRAPHRAVSSSDARPRQDADRGDSVGAARQPTLPRDRMDDPKAAKPVAIHGSHPSEPRGGASRAKPRGRHARMVPAWSILLGFLLGLAALAAATLLEC